MMEEKRIQTELWDFIGQKEASSNDARTIEAKRMQKFGLSSFDGPAFPTASQLDFVQFWEKIGHELSLE